MKPVKEIKKRTLGPTKDEDRKLSAKQIAHKGHEAQKGRSSMNSEQPGGRHDPMRGVSPDPSPRPKSTAYKNQITRR